MGTLVRPEIVGCLSEQATKNDSARRNITDPKIDMDLQLEPFFKSPFQIDALLKLLNSKVMRRLVSKTQVIPGAVNRHIRTRLSHSLEAAGIAFSIARLLGLNEWLAYAATLGHDVGHTPLGHDGERFLAEKTNGAFGHNVFGAFLVMRLDRKGMGLNMTAQVLESILLHGEEFTADALAKLPFPEAAVSQFADKIAFTTADPNDLCRLGLESVSDEFHNVLKLLEKLGANQRERIHKIISALCSESYEKGRLSFWESEVAMLFHEIRRRMWPIYPATHESYKEICARIYNFLERIQGQIGDPVINFAMMTDEDVRLLAQEHLITIETLMRTSIWELIPYNKDKKYSVDLAKVDF